jgi:hypothetical protein
MTTFTTEDRINAVVNVEPIPFAGWVNTAPPHIVDNGASVIIKELTDEQILEIWRENERVYPMDINRLLDRSRAILRKAQEK